MHIKHLFDVGFTWTGKLKWLLFLVIRAYYYIIIYVYFEQRKLIYNETKLS